MVIHHESYLVFGNMLHSPMFTSGALYHNLKIKILFKYFNAYQLHLSTIFQTIISKYFLKIHTDYTFRWGISPASRRFAKFCERVVGGGSEASCPLAAGTVNQ